MLNVQFVPLLNNNQALTVSQLDPATGIGALTLQNRISNSEPSQNFKMMACSLASYFIEHSNDSRYIIQVNKKFVIFTKETILIFSGRQ